MNVRRKLDTTRRRRRRLVLLAGLAIWMCGGTSARAQLANSAWPMAHQNLKHTGRSPYNGPTTPTVKWTVDRRFFIKGSPIIGPDGTVYIAIKQSVCAIEPENGEELWCTQLAGTIRRNAPAIAADGRIYAGDRANRLWAINSANGLQLCSYLVGNDGDVVASPAIVGPGPNYTILMAGSWNGIVHALSPTCGLKWKSPSGGNNRYSSPAVAADGTVYAGTSNGILRALTPDGEETWRLRVGGVSSYASPAIGPDGTIYFGSSYGLTAVDTDGDEVWQYDTDGRVSSTPAFGLNGEIIFGNVGTVAGANARITALDNDMNELWTYPTGAKCFSSPAIGANGTIYAACGRKIFALNPNGTLLWDYEIERGRSIISSPAISADGALYVAADQVYAFQDP